MGLTTHRGGAAGRPAAPLRPSALDCYVAAVATAGLLVAVVVYLASKPVSVLGDQGAWPLLVLSAALVLGELRPIRVARGPDHNDAITISTTFAVALVLLGPLSLAIAMQLVAVLVDDVRNRRDARKMLFNAGQYALTLTASRAAYCVASGWSPFDVREPVPFLGPYQPFHPGHLGAALVAGATYFVVNQALTSLVMALATGTPVVAMLRDDIRFQVATSGVLISLGPVAALTASRSPIMVPLLAAPVVAVHRSADLALQRQDQAHHDALTSLPNRELFRERADRALADSQRLGQPLAVMMIDLDHFKEINDTLGHQVGDELIREVAKRLDDARPTGSTVARLGGDEFAVLLPDVPDLSVAEGVATYMLSVLGRPVAAGGVRLAVQASIGIAISPDHGDDVHTLMRRADIALYDAKRERARFSAYRPEEDVHTPQRLAVLGDLRAAVEEGQLFLEFQPMLAMASGRVVSAEALVRWRHPHRGVIPPDDFVPLAENTGLITPVTWFVIERALEQCAQWHRDGLDLSVAVNLSARHLTDMSLPDRIAVALERWGVPAGRLVVEVTESSIMSDPRRSAGVLSQLRRVGCEVAIDDYGTGHASLSYVKRLDVDELKIDQSFVTGLLEGGNDAIIVRSTIELGHNLGLRIVAEGVEDPDTFEWLRAAGCDVVQGFHIGRPMAGDAVARLARQLAEGATGRAPVPAPGRLHLVRSV